jgi:ADP-dependent NAD(P)H-hydrate dehydratase / NAD(P)H-hydrate epimerase
MIPVVSVSQMRAIDEKAIGGDTAVGYSYMVEAGRGLFAGARDMVPDPGAGEIAVVCGRGNNGGDGYVVARLLLDAGYRVTCFSLCPPGDLKGEAALACRDFAAQKGNVLTLTDTGYLSNLSHFRLIIDCLLGTGASGAPKGIYATAIEAINASGVPVLAADTPSGLDSDAGVPNEPCIRATTTVTLGFPKIGLYFYPGREHVGNLTVHDLKYPQEAVGRTAPTLLLPERVDIGIFLPPRRPAGSKFDHGLALLLCGSKGMTGSASLVARAAQRTGCGMVHLAAPESILPVLAIKLTEPVLHPVPETAQGAASTKAIGKILELAGTMQALCVGPGLSHAPETMELVRSLVSRCPLPTVLDADGINAFKGRAGELASHAGELVITPHRGEWQRLFGEPPPAPMELVEVLKEKAAGFRMTILLKGSPTICVTPSGNAYVLPFGNSALAKAGTGDVLSGIIVSLLAQGSPCDRAALLGAYIHGQAGTIAGRELGEHSVIATDVAETICRVVKDLETGRLGGR